MTVLAVGSLVGLDNKIAFGKEQELKKFLGIEKWNNTSNTFKKLKNTVKQGKQSKNIELDYYESKELEQEAIKLEQQGKYEGAIFYYSILVEAKPHNLDYKNKLKELELLNPEAERAYKNAIHLEQQNQYEEAIFYYEKAVKLDPSNEKYINKLQGLKGKLKRKNKQKVEKYHKKAKELEKQGKLKEAIEYYTQILRLKPTYPEYYQKKIDRIKNEIKEKEESVKKQAEKAYKRAKAAALLRNYENAIYYCKIALKLDPNNTEYSDKISIWDDELKQRKTKEEKDKKRIMELIKGARHI